MRVTQNMIAESFMRNMYQNLSRLGDKNDRISSQRKIRRPSDDPVGTALAMRLRKQLTAMDQYKSNAEDAIIWLKDTESALINTGNIIHRLNELTVQAANDTLTSEDRKKILHEVKELKEQLLQEANSTHVDRYLFSGYHVDEQPFIQDKKTGKIDINPNIKDIDNPGDMKYHLGRNDLMTVNLQGQEIFEYIFDNVQALEDALEGDKTLELSGETLSRIKDSLNHVLKYRSQVGVRTKRLEMTVNKMEANYVDYKNLLSKTEDLDMAKAATELKIEESVYRAALSVGARIVQPNLADFLG